MAVMWGPRGYPGPQGLKGIPGVKGDKGDPGAGVIVTNNENGSVTITGSNGSVVIFDGAPGAPGVSTAGTYLSMVYAEVPTGTSAPTITPGTGSYNGTNEVMPTGSVIWTASPPYTVGYTTYMAINRYVHNSGTNWSLINPNWSAPQIFSINLNPVNRFTSYVFKRSISTPATPTGGNYSNPVPSGWSDGIPASGNEPVWMSKRIFTEDGSIPQETTWSTPALVGADGQGTKFQFAPTNIGPWDDIPAAEDAWMVTCTRQAGQGWVCDYANPVKIAGEEGPVAQSKHLASAFKRSEIDLSALNGGIGEIPEGGSYDAPYPVDGVVTGWTATIPAGSANLYISTRLFTTDSLAPQDANWSGAQLFSGENASNFVLTADSQVFAYDTDSNITPNEINLTVNKQHIGNSTVWSSDPSVTLTSVTDTTAILTAANFDAAGVDVVKITVTAGTFSDTVSIAKVRDGSSALTGLLTNEVDSVFADVTGDPTFNGDEGGEFLVYLGANNVVGDCTFAVNGGSQQTKNGLRMSINTVNGIYTLSENPNWTSDRETFDLVATHTPTGSTITKRYTLTKSKEGAVGAQGTSTRIDIAYGTTSSGGAVNYPSLIWPGGVRTYTSASSTNKTFIGTNAITWAPDEVAPDYGEPLVSLNANDYEWTEFVGGNGVDGSNGLSTRLDIAYADNYNGVTASGNLRFPSNSSNPTPATPAASNRYIGTDVVTWDSSLTPPNASQNQATYEWTRYQGNDGQSGADALSIVLSNSSHIIPCYSDGSVASYDNSGTLISVFEGATELNSVSGTLTPGTFKITGSPVVTPTGRVTVDPSPAYTGNPITYGDVSNWTPENTTDVTAKITYTVNGQTLDGTPFSGLVAEQTLSKNIGGGGVGGPSTISTSGAGAIHGPPHPGPTPAPGDPPTISHSIVHQSQNNSMEVTWRGEVSIYSDNNADVNNPPVGTIYLELWVNGVYSTQVELVSDGDDSAHWKRSCANQTTIVGGLGTGPVTFELKWDGNTSLNDPVGSSIPPMVSKDLGFITVVETL